MVGVSARGFEGSAQRSAPLATEERAVTRCRRLSSLRLRFRFSRAFFCSSASTFKITFFSVVTCATFSKALRASSLSHLTPFFWQRFFSKTSVRSQMVALRAIISHAIFWKKMRLSEPLRNVKLSECD